MLIVLQEYLKYLKFTAIACLEEQYQQMSVNPNFLAFAEEMSVRRLTAAAISRKINMAHKILLKSMLPSARGMRKINFGDRD
ncbi:hypothetical protein BIW11_10020 [Tropilaelaps mercedesae]|uniref:Uncharacterized protein n=1 Tax=Tropilaelaps mercedesae TaxID=418985 RepID=A0A1V9XHL5_9ACAR|nr:hypothetical protein BIW11_10020 [Tropilaelaps mercedesae]